ncbi:MAG: PIN domain-containing protein [Rikenellaceae bacterium]
MDRLCVFLDTNVIESYMPEGKINKTKLVESNFKILPSSLFIEIQRIIRAQGLETLIDLCVVDITLSEIKQHLLDCYKLSIKHIKDIEKMYTAHFSDTFTMLYEFTHANEDAKMQHIETLIQDFLKVHNCVVVEHPQKVVFYEDIIKQCINKVPPFYTKTDNDAGFKDAVIAQTIRNYKFQKENCECILITKDTDFDKVEGLYIIKDVKQFTIFLDAKFKIADVDIVRDKLMSDYWRGYIILETGNECSEKDESVTCFDIVNLNHTSDDEYKAEILFVINETRYNVSIVYDKNSNSIIDFKYDIEDE